MTDEHPWRDEERLYREYIEKENSTTTIAEKWDCSDATVSRWLDRHDIQTRSKDHHKHLQPACFYTLPDGHEMVESGDDKVLFHRLLALTEYTMDELDGKHIHHKNNVPWDNRIENLQVVSPAEHNQIHLSKTTSPSSAEQTS